MSEVLIAEIKKSGDEVIRITRIADHGRCRVALREWFRDAAGEWRPGRGGISIKQENAAQVVGAVLTAATPDNRGRS